MSGGARANEDDAAAKARRDAVERLLDEEMKDDVSTTPSTCESVSASASGSESGSGSRAGSRPGSATETTWNFVQMNMSLLPIARPLPVSVPSRLQEGLAGRKPRTPNQKLHHRVLRSASNISPRHNDPDSNMLRRRGSTSSENGTTSAFSIPRPTVPERQFSAPLSLSTRCGKRKSDHEDDHYLSSSWQSPSLFYRPHAGSDSDHDDSNRVRSFSEDLVRQDGATSGVDGSTLSRSASTSAAFAHRGALFKDKRILEIQDEERRLLPNERAGLASPSKRSRRS